MMFQHVAPQRCAIVEIRYHEKGSRPPVKLLGEVEYGNFHSINRRLQCIMTNGQSGVDAAPDISFVL